ncbi:MAG: hypothetical protein APR54_10965 [Candidatus Cloacimonas sp. SDB]|nr:MAG: hypothetical protein APR54_10965 [Candidatus Cloacimonas sp. SDB]
MIKNCPVCKSKMKIKEFQCTQCNTRIIGDFSLDDLQDIQPEIMDFIKVFIFTEGNIKKVEKIMNCSYPKVKNYLKKAKEYLGVDYPEEVDQDSQESSEILDQLSKGEIDLEEAIKLLNKGEK